MLSCRNAAARGPRGTRGENTRLEVMVRYLVHPREAGRVKTRLLEKLVLALNAAPDKVLFPKSNMR